MVEKKTGLVLEGGAMRGLFTAGVLDVLLEKRIIVNGVVGVSAGAAFGCNYISNQPRRALRYNLAYCKDPRYYSFRSLIKTGNLFGVEFCYHEIPEKLDPFDYETFDRSNIEFHVVGTDIKSGKAVYHFCPNSHGDAPEWIRASSSMPVVSRPVSIGNLILLDGGISDPIPLRYFLRKGFERNIVVLTQPRNFQKEKPPMIAAARIKLRKYPSVVRAIERQHILYNKKRRDVFEHERKGDIIVICPKEELPIQRVTHDDEKIIQTYLAGRTAAEEKLEEINAFFSAKREPNMTKNEVNVDNEKC